MALVPNWAYTHITQILSNWPCSWYKHVKGCSCHQGRLGTRRYGAKLNLRVKVYFWASNRASGGLWKKQELLISPCEWAALTQLPNSSQLGLCTRKQPGHCLVPRYVSRKTWQGVSSEQSQAAQMHREGFSLEVSSASTQMAARKLNTAECIPVSLTYNPQNKKNARH